MRNRCPRRSLRRVVWPGYRTAAAATVLHAYGQGERTGRTHNNGMETATATATTKRKRNANYNDVHAVQVARSTRAHTARSRTHTHARAPVHTKPLNSVDPFRLLRRPTPPPPPLSCAHPPTTAVQGIDLCIHKVREQEVQYTHTHTYAQSDNGDAFEEIIIVRLCVLPRRCRSAVPLHHRRRHRTATARTPSKFSRTKPANSPLLRTCIRARARVCVCVGCICT